MQFSQQQSQQQLYLGFYFYCNDQVEKRKREIYRRNKLSYFNWFSQKTKKKKKLDRANDLTDLIKINKFLSIKQS